MDKLSEDSAEGRRRDGWRRERKRVTRWRSYMRLGREGNGRAGSQVKEEGR